MLLFLLSKGRPWSYILNRDLALIYEQCKLWGMKLDLTKTQSMIVSGSRMPLPLHTDLFIDGTVLSTTGFLRF